MQRSHRHEILANLMGGHPATQRRFLRLAVAFGGTVLVLHITVAASVIPYVYVTDSMANCGARVILGKFGSDLWTIGGLLFLAVFFTGYYQSLWAPPTPLPDTRLFRWGKPVVAMLASVAIIIALIVDVTVSLDDIKFLHAPPVIKWKDTVCPGVEWKTSADTLPPPD